MKKVNNIKADFSKILESKYRLTKEGIEGYWINKEKEEKYNKKSDICFGLGVLGAYSGAVLVCVAINSNSIQGIAFATAAFVDVAISSGLAISYPFSNPYKLKENIEIDEEYKKFKSEYKKLKHKK